MPSLRNLRNDAIPFALAWIVVLLILVGVASCVHSCEKKRRHEREAEYRQQVLDAERRGRQRDLFHHLVADGTLVPERTIELYGGAETGWNEFPKHDSRYWYHWRLRDGTAWAVAQDRYGFSKRYDSLDACCENYTYLVKFGSPTHATIDLYSITNSTLDAIENKTLTLLPARRRPTPGVWIMGTVVADPDDTDFKLKTSEKTFRMVASDELLAMRRNYYDERPNMPENGDTALAFGWRQKDGSLMVSSLTRMVPAVK